MKPGILDGIKVLDLGRYVAGPYCATLLGYFGADVIRIERPEGGEDRYIAPIDSSDAGSVMFQTGCNKRSLTLNLRHPESREILDKLVAESDVVVANLPPQALTRLGLNFERLTAINPRLILTSVTAFGTEGPWAKRGGFDGVGQAMSGSMYMTGTPGEPAKAAAPYVDYSSAVLAACGTLAALYEREKTGKGQQVEGSLLATALSVFGSHLIEEAALTIGRQPSGNRVQTSGPSDLFATRDGHVLIHVVGNGLFRRLATVIGANEWLEDKSLETDQQRGNRRDDLCERVADWCRSRASAVVLETFAEAGVPAGPVLSLQEALSHPQVTASKLFKEVDYPGHDAPVRVPDIPLSFSNAEVGIHHRPPVTSEHTREILTALGYEEAQIDRLFDEKIV